MPGRIGKTDPLFSQNLRRKTSPYPPSGPTKVLPCPSQINVGAFCGFRVSLGAPEGGVVSPEDPRDWFPTEGRVFASTMTRSVRYCGPLAGSSLTSGTCRGVSVEVVCRRTAVGLMKVELGSGAVAFVLGNQVLQTIWLCEVG